jgi:hypothetical protein
MGQAILHLYFCVHEFLICKEDLERICICSYRFKFGDLPQMGDICNAVDSAYFPL